MATKTATLMNTRVVGIRFGHLFAFFASIRLAVVLLAVLAALLTVYLLVPQDPKDVGALSFLVETSSPGEKLTRGIGLTDVQNSYLLFGTYALLFVNLVLCMIRRFRLAVRLCRFPESPPTVSPLWFHHEVGSTRLDAEEVAEVIRRRGYRPLVTGNAIYGLRGRFAMLGHWVFHLSFLVLLVGGMWVATAPDPFRGTLGVGEGEPFDLHRAPFLTTNIAPSQDLPELRFRMEKIDVVTDGEEVRRFDARFSTPEDGLVTAGINRPYRKRPYQVLVTGFGYMPGWVVVNSRGRMLHGAWVKLVPFPLQTGESFSIGTDGSTVRVRFFPDYQSNGKEARNRSNEPRNPRFDTRIVWHGKQVFEGLLKPDERVPLGRGQEFFFLPKIRKYGLLEIMQEQRHEIIFVGLGILILGIVIRYARIRKEILVRMEGGSLHLFGRSEILENLFAEEMRRLAEELEEIDPPPQSRRKVP